MATIWEQVARLADSAALGAVAYAITLRVMEAREWTNLHRVLGHPLRRR